MSPVYFYASSKWQISRKNEPARPLCAQESIFWAKNPNFYGRKQKFWYPRNGKTTLAPCSMFVVGMGPNGPKMPMFGPK